MNPKHPRNPHDLPDFDPELESDALWQTLGEASSPEIPPRFTADTVRRCRLEADSPKTAWWQKLLSPKPLIGTAVAALAAVAIIVSLPDPAPSAPPQAEAKPDDAPAAVDDWANLEDSLASELLSEAAEDPTLLSDEEIVSLLF